MEIVTEGQKRIKVGKEEFFLPYHNLWNQNIYKTTQPFSNSPTFCRSNSTSGSPVILGKKLFAGFLNPHTDSKASYDGEYLTLTISEKQSLFYEEGNPYSSWQHYNKYVSSTFSTETKHTVPSLSEIEYCTWVEQKAVAEKCFGSSKMPETTSVLSDDFIEKYMNRIDVMGLPKGVLTIDHGWQKGAESFNFDNFLSDKKKFKNFQKTIQRIRNAGFIPGLWFAPAFYYKDSAIYTRHPELIGERFTGSNEGGFEFPLYYIEVTDENKRIILNWYIELFTPYIEMGVRKLKIDFTYNNKSKMIIILELIYQAVKSINREVEVEGHIPDIFASRYQDAVRLNDIIIDTTPDWRGLFKAHYDVCLNSAYKKVLNLDHIGANSPNISEADFLSSLELFKGKKGYPTVSMLPDNFSQKTVLQLKEYLHRYAIMTNQK